MRIQLINIIERKKTILKKPETWIVFCDDEDIKDIILKQVEKEFKKRCRINGSLEENLQGYFEDNYYCNFIGYEINICYSRIIEF